MRCVIVSSPGAAVAPHWSHAFAAALSGQLGAAGAEVGWFAAARRADEVPPAPAGVERSLHLRAPLPLHRAVAGVDDTELEVAVARALRADRTDALVHVGFGAGASAHLTWLAERLGTLPFAVVRGSEVVCLRGDLVHASGAACCEFLDPERCRRCCAPSWWRRPHTVDVQNRLDLVVAGLSSATVFVAEPGDVEVLVAAGVSRRGIEVATPAELAVVVARRVLAIPAG